MADLDFVGVSQCVLCGAVLGETARECGFGFQIRSCRKCDLGHTDPRPKKEDIYLLYERESGASALDIRDFYSDSGLVEKAKSFLMRRSIRRRMTNIDGVKTVLDFGCGNGSFSNALHHVIPNARIVASDFSPSRPSELDPAIEYVISTDAMTKNFDLIVLRHVLEHFDDPVVALREFRSMLSENGRIYIEVPNSRCAMAVLFRQRWIHWYVPRHVHHFSKTSLGECLRQAKLDGVVRYCDLPSMGVQLASVLGASRYNLLWKIFGAGLQPVEYLIEQLFLLFGFGGGNAIYVFSSRSER